MTNSPEMSAQLRSYAARRAAGPPAPPDPARLRAGFSPAPTRLPRPPDVAVAEAELTGPRSSWVSVRGTATTDVVLYLHGGGFVAGSLDTHVELAGRIARETGTRVLFPEYRLAPEHPFPAALDDVLTAWRWLRGRGHPATSIAVVGDSAGAGLALTVPLALRSAGEELPAVVVAMSPVTDLTLTGVRAAPHPDDDLVLTPAAIRYLTTAYRGDADPRDPLLSPLYGDLAGLPPLLLQVGGPELLRSDSERFADRVRAAGGEVTLEVVPGMPHVFQAMAPAPEAYAATARIGRFVRRFLD